jgi:F-type H+-transporting ATPase subunit alpha
VCARFESADKLSDEDRNRIIEIARQALAPFQAKPDLKADQKPEPALGAKPKSESTPKTESEPKAKAEPDGAAKPDALAKPAAATEDKS